MGAEEGGARSLRRNGVLSALLPSGCASLRRARDSLRAGPRLDTQPLSRGGRFMCEGWEDPLAKGVLVDSLERNGGREPSF